MKNYIYTVLKEFARNFKEKHGIRPSKWDCMCYMTGYNPDEPVGNIFKALEVLYEEDIITYCVSADERWINPLPYSD